MNGEQKSGVSTIRLGRLQCIRRDSAGPTDRRRRRRRRGGGGGGGRRRSLEIGDLSSGVSIDVLNAFLMAPMRVTCSAQLQYRILVTLIIGNMTGKVCVT
jgi:hypothetical protein